MHRDLPGGNIKLVLILFSALGPSDLGPGLQLLQLDSISSPSMTQVGTSIFWIGPPVHHLLARLQLCPLVPRVAHLVYLDDMQRCKYNAIKGKT